MLLGFLMWAPITVVYSMPGSPHALVTESSLDSFRQGSLQRTVVSNEVSRGTDDIAMPTNPDDAGPPEDPDESLANQPFAFISDTDSVEYLLDTGANRFIVNNPKLLSDLLQSAGM
jgi:hypothetical protein